MFLRADGPDHHVLTLHGGSEPAGLDHFAFEVDHPDDIERAADMLSALGHEIVTPPTQELEPGVAQRNSLQGSRRQYRRAGLGRGPGAR